MLSELSTRFEQEFAKIDSDQDGEITFNEAKLLFQQLNIPYKNFVRVLQLMSRCNDGKRFKVSDFMTPDVKLYLLNCMKNCLPEFSTTLIDKKKEYQVNVSKIQEILAEEIERGARAPSFLLYLVLLVIYGVVVTLQLSPWNSASTRAAVLSYFADQTFTSSIATTLLTFHDIQSVQDLWKWQIDVFVNKFYIQSYYNGEPLSSLDANYLLEHIKKMGTFRVLQRRSRNGTCAVKMRFPAFESSCYGETWSDGLEGAVEKASFVGAVTGQTYKYTDAPWYDSGYLQTFSSNKDSAVAQLQTLQQDGWINASSRYWRLDFSAYSPDVSLFIYTKFQVELRTTGEMLPSAEVESRRLHYYRTSTDFVRLAFECLLLLCNLAFALRQVVLLRTRKERIQAILLVRPITLLAISQGLLLVTCIGLWIRIIVKGESMANSLQVDQQGISWKGGSMFTLYDISSTFKAYFALHACNFIVAMMILLDLLRFNPSMEMVIATLSAELRVMVAFFFVMVLFVVTIAVDGMMLFSRSSPLFSNLRASINSLLSLLHGHRTAKELVNISPTSLYSLYLPLILCFFFFLVPLFIAVLYHRLLKLRTKVEEARRKKGGRMNDSLIGQLLLGIQLWLPRRWASRRVGLAREFLEEVDKWPRMSHMMFEELMERLDRKLSEAELSSLVDECDAYENDCKDFNVDPAEVREKDKQETEELYEDIARKMDSLLQDNKLAYQRLSFMQEVMGYQE